MARRKWIDKKSASHFTLLHRPQNDPRIHDESAPAMVLNPTELPNANKSARPASKHLDELAAQLGSDADNIRANEGEAANYGVYFDDTEYDYMQHLREMGSGGGEAVFVESTASLNLEKARQKEKQKQSLADALKEMDINAPGEPAGGKPSLLDEDILPSRNLRHITYQNQQDVPDTIAGFQPDMDPRLREALEALEDDAYVDNDDDGDDMFQQLAQDGEELDAEEFEETYDGGFDDGYGDGDDGWESDATERPQQPDQKGGEEEVAPQLVETKEGAEAQTPDPNWMDGFKQFKKDQQESSSSSKAAAAAAAAGGPRKKTGPDASEIQSSIWTTTTMGGRKKKRKGALTQQSGFSMTSSSLVRTEQLTLLDARFEKIDEEYNNDEDLVYGGSISDMKSVSGVSSVSSVQGPLRNDFDSIMDDFLGGYTMQGKRKIRKGRPQTGLEQLDEIRRELGPARVSTRYK